jgi:hypothetical protein
MEEGSGEKGKKERNRILANYLLKTEAVCMAIILKTGKHENKKNKVKDRKKMLCFLK